MLSRLISPNPDRLAGMGRKDLFQIIVLGTCLLVCCFTIEVAGALSKAADGTFNANGSRHTWVTALDADALEKDLEEADPGFSSLDGMLQWAIGNSDPTKLKHASQEAKRLTPEELAKRRSEIKELMDKLKMPSDAELMKTAVEDLNNLSLPAEDHQRALEELLILVEPIDNANGMADLNKFGGLVAIIKQLERTEEELRITAAWVLGKASQNNPVVQNQILQLGVLPRLMKMVRSNCTEEAVKALYAVSAVIRNYPSGQEAFYLEDGSSLLQDILSNKSADIRLRKKILFLVADLAEQQLEFGGRLLRHGPTRVLLKCIVELMKEADLDTQEKALTAALSLARLDSTIRDVLRDFCGLDAALKHVKLRLQELMQDDNHLDFAHDLEKTYQEILQLMSLDDSQEKSEL